MKGFLAMTLNSKAHSFGEGYLKQSIIQKKKKRKIVNN